MKGLNKLIMVLLIFVFCIFQSTFVFAGEISDIDNSWAKPQIEDLINLGVLEGYEDNTIKPDGLITRAEFATMLARAMGVNTDVSTDKIYFRDVKPTDWYYGPITALKELSIIDGYEDKTFKPETNISRAEMLTMLVRISKANLLLSNDFKIYKDVTLTHWAYWNVGIASRAGIIANAGDRLYPDQVVTRAEVAYSMDKMLWNQVSSTLSQDEIISLASKYNNLVNDKYSTNNTDMSELESMSYGQQLELLSNLAKRNALYGSLGVKFDRQMNIVDTKFQGSNNLASVSFYYELVNRMILGSRITTTNQKGTLTYSLRRINNQWLVYAQNDQISNDEELDKLNLVWDTNVNTDSFKGGVIDGLDVLSPTWFDLMDGTGYISSRANERYVTWAHNNGYTVWPLMTNGFNPQITSEMLRNSTTRKKVISKILYYVDNYKLDGINIDFENMYKDDKDLFTQFIRELSGPLKSRGVLLSVDVTVIANSSWSDCYDRTALAQLVDYVAVMTYDQHWSTSPTSGSVAQLSWVESEVKEILGQVPKEKLLLGLPFYVREWKETTGVNGITVQSEALSMAQAKQRIANSGAKMVWDSVSGQYYAQYIKDGAVYKIWLEDANSINLKSQLVKKYDLAGVASWKAGLETSDIWPILKTNLDN